MNTMSIGAIGAVAYDPVSDRSKGLFATMHHTVADIACLVAEAGAAHHDGTRLTIRVPIPMGLDLRLVWCIRAPWRENAELACEAVIPIGRRGLAAIAYYGANAASRRSPVVTRCREWVLLEKTSANLSVSRSLSGGFLIELLTCASDVDIHRLEAIYQASFQSYGGDLSSASIARMMEENTVSVARNSSGTIVAVTQAEIAPLDIMGTAWRLVELSETATDPDYRSMGLSQFCKMALVDAVRGSDTIIYAESRANHCAVLRSNRKIGLRPVGRLEQHCRMDSHAKEFSQDSAYANLFVFAL